MGDITATRGAGDGINGQMLSANGKIDGFMDAFKKEVVPEIQAVF